MIDVIAFDADDTLWHSEVLYTRAQEKLRKLLSIYGGDDGALERLYQTEMQNLAYYGYGIKGFTLSMIETAVSLTGGRLRGGDVQQIVDFAKEMIRSPVQLLDHVPDVVAALAASYPLMVITKGDLVDQERKLAQSGLATHFTSVEVVTDKTEDVYRALLEKYQIDPQRFLMVGNSLRSDILPVVALGGRAVHIPYHVTWPYEEVTPRDEDLGRYVELEHFGLLPALVERLGQGGGR